MKLERTKLDALTCDPANVRKHDQRNLDAIKASLQRFGQQHPIIVDAAGVIRAGNGRYMAMRALGWSECDIVRTDLKGSEATAFAIADNRTAELATWDEDALAQQLAALQIEDEALALATGYDAKEIEALALDASELVEDEAPEPPADPITKPGDLYILGEHRLLCGDSTKAEDVARLMDGRNADMMQADPPYGVSYDGGHFHSGDVNIKRSREKLASDDSTDIYGKFLPLAMQVVDGPCYLWFAGSLGRAVYSAVEDAGGVISTLLIWHKTNATYAAMNAQYKQRHEPCLYFKRKGSTLRWCGPSDACTVWEFKREASNKLHPTQKPVDLIAYAIRNHDAPLVYDPFLGSGTTLVAAEQLGRKCYGMEISPAYCDVIVKRWETLTGRKATRA
jgi:DNA modification methylase